MGDTYPNNSKVYIGQIWVLEGKTAFPMGKWGMLWANKHGFQNFARLFALIILPNFNHPKINLLWTIHLGQPCLSLLLMASFSVELYITGVYKKSSSLFTNEKSPYSITKLASSVQKRGLKCWVWVHIIFLVTVKELRGRRGGGNSW